MSGPLEDLIRKAVESAPALEGDDVVGYLAEQLDVILRSELEHVGWLKDGTFTVDQQDGAQAVFCIPARTVQATMHAPLVMTTESSAP